MFKICCITFFLLRFGYAALPSESTRFSGVKAVKEDVYNTCGMGVIDQTENGISKSSIGHYPRPTLLPSVIYFIFF